MTGRGSSICCPDGKSALPFAPRRHAKDPSCAHEPHRRGHLVPVRLCTQVEVLAVVRPARCRRATTASPSGLARNVSLMGLPRLLERRMSRFLRQPPSVRTAAGVIVSATAIVVVVSGVLMRVLDHREYPDIWVGMWWALQTVTTVGYGDVTPKHWSGRLVAVFVMLQGIAFLAIVTAAITSTFVARAERESEACAGEAGHERHREDRRTPGRARSQARRDRRGDPRIQRHLTGPPSGLRYRTDVLGVVRKCARNVNWPSLTVRPLRRAPRRRPRRWPRAAHVIGCRESARTRS